MAEAELHEQVAAPHPISACSCGWTMHLLPPKYQQRVFVDSVNLEWKAHSLGKVVPEYGTGVPLSMLTSEPEWDRAMFGSETMRDRLERASRLSVPRRFR